ncbi:hypothetical protein Tco_1191253 [Tanacetum coccineum]
MAFREPASGIIHKLLTVEGQGKGIATDEHVAQSLLELQTPKKTSTTDQYIFQRQIPMTEEASTGPSTQPEDDTSANIARDTSSPTDAETGAETDKTNSERDIEILNIREEQGEDVANKAGPNSGQSHVALAGPDPEPMHDDFVSTMYPQVHESLKHPDEEHVHLKNPLSSTGTLSSMKNLDNFTFGDQFIADKSLEDEPRNANMETKVESMVIVLIHQASSSVPPLSTPVINLSIPKPVVFTLELQDLPYKIDQTVKEAIQIALQAPLRERFKDLSEADMKEILSLEASMEHDNRDDFLTEKDKSHKRRRNDQDPLPPPTKNSKQRKKKKQDSDASADDIPIPDVKHISDLEDTSVAHLPKIKTRPDWLKPDPEEDIPETPEPN